MNATRAFYEMQTMPEDLQDPEKLQKYNEQKAYEIANGGVHVNPLVNQEGMINLVSKTKTTKLIIIIHRRLITKMIMKKVQMMTVLVRSDNCFFCFDEEVQKIVFKMEF